MDGLIKHIVMWKLKDFAEGKTKDENAISLKRSLESLEEKIGEVRFSIEVGINITQAEQAYDIVLYAEFQCIEDLNIYMQHPEHVKVSEYISKVREVRVVTDYEI